MVYRSIAALCLWTASAVGAEAPWPTMSWREAIPEAERVDSQALAEALDFILQKRLPIHSLLIVRHGTIVLDAYFYPYDGSVVHDVASATKSVTSILAGIAIDKGYLKNENETMLSLLGGRPDGLKERITVRDLLTMTSGLRCGSVGEAHTAEDELAEMRRHPNWIAFALTIPMRFEPGRKFAYCSVNNHILSAMITATTGKSLESFARETLFEPLGIKTVLWPKDPQGLNHGWGDLHLYPRDMAKLGYLCLRGGKWDGRQVVSSEWIEKLTKPYVTPFPGVGYCYSWWINLQRQPNVFEAEGRAGQRISVIPDKDAVVVFTAGGRNKDLDLVAPFIMRALKSDSPLPLNIRASARLRRGIKAVRQAPSPIHPAPVPDIFQSISAKQFKVEPNPIDFRSFSLTFGQRRTAEISLVVGDEEWTGRAGLDGVYRFSPHGHLALPMAVSGKWQSPTELVVDVNLVANITRLLFTFQFADEEMEVKITDATGSFHDVVARAHSVTVKP
jgi:CubicO group peptidase (beta-lactamase class C family)